MKNKIIRLICILTIMCICIMISACSDNTASDAAKEQGSSTDEAELIDMKDFTAVSSDDEKITQSYFGEHDATIINVWGTFCPPCLEEMPKLAELEEVRPDNIGMLLICTDALAEPDRMQEILDEAGYKGINLVRGNGDFAKQVGNIRYVPTTFFVDREGNLIDEPVIGQSLNPKMTYYKHINRYFKEVGIDTVG